MSEFVELSDHVVVRVDEIAAIRWVRFVVQQSDPCVIVTLRNGQQLGRYWSTVGDVTPDEGNAAAERLYAALLQQLPLLKVDVDG